MNETVIRVAGLGKRFRIGRVQARHDTLRDVIAARAAGAVRRLGSFGRARSPTETEATIWALRDVNFEVARGEVLGIIGPNGAGKSTLLKILSRITEPTTGEAQIRGRVGSLLEVGTGFHPELTGRENVYLNGAILGMVRAEIERKFDEIVAFAEVERFIDTPVKHYSSGMYLRLAFGVAAHLEPDILMVDEVLAVGDAAFQQRCMGKMGSVAQEGRTVLFVSHNMQAVSSLCSRALLLEGGGITFSGEVQACIADYSGRVAGTRERVWIRPTGAKAAALVVEEVRCEVSGRQPDHTLELQLGLRSCSRHQPAFLAVDILEAAGTPLMQALPRLDGFIRADRDVHDLEVSIALPPLVPGRYLVTVWVGTHNTTTVDQVERVVSFEIHESPTEGRSYPHTRDHGYIVPPSTIRYLGAQAQRDGARIST